MKRTGAIVFIVAVFFVLLLPFAGMARWATTKTTENTPLAERPSFTTGEGQINVNYLSDWGTYFEDRFAFRPNLITANAKLYGKVFGQSTTNQVVLGKEGWLFYGGTLEDYQGTNLMSERDWFCLTQNLQLMQEYVESQGSGFLLTVAPNKNSLYGEYMPARFLPGKSKNIDALAGKLREAGVPYVDLYALFRAQEEPLYFKKDSHWDNRGAVLAYRGLMEAMNKPHETYLNVPWTQQDIHTGDLEEMLYPEAIVPETDYIYERKQTFISSVEDYMENWIETENPDKQGTLLMYRDSFGESLTPLLAQEFGKGYFSRLVPYHLTQIEQYRPDFVVIERVERRLSSFAEEAPIMPAPQRENVSALTAKTDSVVKAEQEGSYLSVSGTVASDMIQDDTRLYLEVINQKGEKKTYQPFILSKNGFQLYLKEETVPSGTIQMNLIAEIHNQYVIVGSADFTK